MDANGETVGPMTWGDIRKQAEGGEGRHCSPTAGRSWRDGGMAECRHGAGSAAAVATVAEDAAVPPAPPPPPGSPPADADEDMEDAIRIVVDKAQGVGCTRVPRWRGPPSRRWPSRKTPSSTARTFPRMWVAVAAARAVAAAGTRPAAPVGVACACARLVRVLWQRRHLWP